MMNFKTILLLVLISFGSIIQPINTRPLSDTAIVFDIDDVLIQRPIADYKLIIKKCASLIYHAERPFKAIASGMWWLASPTGIAKRKEISHSRGTYAIIDAIVAATPAFQQQTVYQDKRQSISDALKDIIATGKPILEMFGLVEELKKNHWIMYATNQGKEVTEHNIVLGTLPKVNDSLHPFGNQGDWIKKPHPLYYQELNQRVPATYKKVIVIDDKAENIEQANKTDERMHAIVYKNPVQIKQALKGLKVL